MATSPPAPTGAWNWPTAGVGGITCPSFLLTFVSRKAGLPAMMRMPTLILSMDGLVLKEIALSKERITIGRKAHNDVQIDNLAISGEHACITTILNDAFLEDQNSTNGTYVNGQPVKKHVLHNNDVIELGKYRLKYLVDTTQPGLSPSEMVETSALKPFEMPPTATDVSPPEGRPAAGDGAALRTQVLGPDALDRAARTAVPRSERIGMLQ